MKGQGGILQSFPWVLPIYTFKLSKCYEIVAGGEPPAAGPRAPFPQYFVNSSTSTSMNVTLKAQFLQRFAMPRRRDVDKDRAIVELLSQGYTPFLLSLDCFGSPGS